MYSGNINFFCTRELTRIAINSAVGQTDIAELLIQISTDNFVKTDWNDRDRSVFQTFGSIYMPQLVGIFSHGEIRTILDLRTRKVFFSDLKRWEDSILGTKTQTLINLWERARWENHLSESR